MHGGLIKFVDDYDFTGMTRHKQTNMAKNNIIIYLIIGIVILVATGVIDLGGIISSGDDSKVVDSMNACPFGVGVVPSDGKTTITLNTGDALATSALGANVSYYVFEKDSGMFLKEGTTSAGTTSFTLPYCGEYSMILYDDDATGVDYLPVTLDLIQTYSSAQPVNVDLYRESAATIDKVRDPVDFDTNVSTTAGALTEFDIRISATTANAVLNNPVIRVEAQSNCTEEVYLPTLKSVTCPDRLAADAILDGEWCFMFEEQIISKDGARTFAGSFLVDSSTDCSAVSVDSNMTFSVIDTGMYIESDYKTQGISAFKFGTENPTGNVDVGASDATNTGFLSFN